MAVSKPEVFVVLLSILAVLAHYRAWRTPPRLDRETYVGLLVEAGASGRSPQEVAREKGYLDRELGRAAWNLGDHPSEIRIAENLWKRNSAAKPDS